MDFIDKVRQFSLRVDSLKDSVLTEEATKTRGVIFRISDHFVAFCKH